MKAKQFQKLLRILLFLINCSSIANGQSQIPSVSSETPIRFQVEIPTNHPDSKLPLLYEKDWGVLMLPKNYKSAGTPVPLVIGCHGGGGTVSSNGSQTESYDLYKYLVSLGYAVMDMAGMPESYSKRLKIDHYRCEGSYIAVRAYEEGYRWVIRNYNIDPGGCYITGGSNGGLTATNLVSISTIPVICQAGMSPLLSVKEQAWNITGGGFSGGEFSTYQNRANIIRIFEMQDVKTLAELINAKYEEDKVGNFDPFRYKVTFDGDKMIKKYRCPVKIWQPVDDPVISIDFSRKFIAALNNAGVKALLVEMPGGGHAPESYGQTLGNFEYQGKKYEIKPAVYELALWFGEYSGISLQGQGRRMHPLKQKISIEWSKGKPSGTMEILNGSLTKIEVIKGRGKIKGNRFEFTSSGIARIEVEIDSIKNHPGPEATLISVITNSYPFSFFLRDVSKEFPIYIPDYSVVVLRDTDNRSYSDVQLNILSGKLQTKLQKIESEPEESFESAERRTLNQTVPTWLGISRDFRIFQITESMPNMPSEANVITPKFSSSPLVLTELSKSDISYSYTLGRGVSVEINTSRKLEERVLPILHSTHIDDDIEYYSTSFVSLEKSSLTGQSVKGTHYLVADKYSAGNMFTKEQEEILKPKLKEAFNTTEETVLYLRSEVTNKGTAPRYAWFKTIKPGSGWWQKFPYTFDPGTGLSTYSTGSVFCVSKLNGNPLPNEEVAVLLQPGEKAVFEFFLPHAPISNERALVLSKQSFDEKFIDCKIFWQTKLQKAAQIHVPEKRIEEMIQAGLLHLDLITYGNEPVGTLVPSIGVYTAIGTESSPIIQFYNSMGWHDIAKRSLTFFLDKQHEDGFMQNFGGYMVETGAVLWSLGEYFRYTHDKEWIEQIKPKVLKSCDFLIKWRAKNKVDTLRGKGFGMIDGKVADPEDNFHQFMLNGYAYLGLSRVSEMLAEIDPDQSNRIKKEAEEWKRDIRESFFNEMALSPVVPLGDGTWSLTVPPWTEATGLRALYAKRENFFSHGTVTVSDAMLGPLYLVFCEVLGVNEPASKMMLDYHSELFYQNNSAFSQPYYSRHNWIQSKLGLVKPFLKTYYNTFSALADRETYTFWEHLYHASSHKTHEEGWFLMETRWMLYLEDSTTLRLLGTIPRKWMEDGKTIELKGVQSYFGPLNVKVNSGINKGYIEAAIQCNSDRKPGDVTIRLPHPDGKKAVKVTGGEYNKDTETVTVKSFNGNVRIRVEY